MFGYEEKWFDKFQSSKVASANRYRLNPHFLKWFFYCTRFSDAGGRNGSNIGTNCSIASEIVFYVPHNDLSSFSILRAVEKSISSPFSLKKTFFFSEQKFLCSFSFERQQQKTWRMKMSFSVINSIFNLVCTFLSSFCPRQKPRKKWKQTAFLHMTKEKEREKKGEMERLHVSQI